MTKCEHWGSGWCYAPVDVKTNAIGKFGVCKLPEYCPYLKSQNKMTDMIFSTDGEEKFRIPFPIPEIITPTHKLEIKKMTEIEKTEGEIKVLQSKLSFLEELSKTKSPIEKVFYRVYGCYPPTTPSVSNSEDERWSNFQKGYNASKEECKVEEEPKPTPETLYNIVRHLLGYSIDCCDEIVDAVEDWLPDELEYDGEFPDAYAYERGWNAAIRTMKRKLR